MIVLNTVQSLQVLTAEAARRAIKSFTIGHHSITLRQDQDRPAAVKESIRAARGQIRIRVTINADIAATLEIAPRKAVHMT